MRLHILPEFIGLLGDRQLRLLVKRYADLLRVPIFLPSDSNPVNLMVAPWDDGLDEGACRAFLSERFPDDEILGIIPIDYQDAANDVKLKGCLFVPKQQKFIVREHGDLSIYCRRYFVCADNRTLLPRWARFVKGIVDTPSLTEMASREAVLANDRFDRVQEALGKVILDWITDLPKTNPDLLREVVTNHNIVLKAWAVVDDRLFQAIKDLVLFATESSLMTIPQYLSNLGSPVKESTAKNIFFFTKKGGPGQHAILFKARGLHVIDASGFPDFDFLRKIEAQDPEVELHQLDIEARGYIFEPLEIKERKWGELESAFADIQVTAEATRFVPENIPAVLLRDESARDRAEEAKALLQDPNLSPNLKRLISFAIERQESDARELGPGILYLNTANPIIQHLADSNLRDGDIMEVLTAVYHNALLLSLQGARMALTPQSAQAVFEGNNRTIELLLTKVAELRELQAERLVAQAAMGTAGRKERSRPRKKHVLCFAAVPFDPAYEPILQALRHVLEGPPYYWEVSRADQEYFQRSLPDNVAAWIDQADAFVAEISDTNPNVMMELGLAYWTYPDRPLILLQREGSQPSIVDLGGILRINYPSPKTSDTTEVERVMRSEMAKFGDTMLVPNKERYLSLASLRRIRGIDPDVLKAIANRFATFEDFLGIDPMQLVAEKRTHLDDVEIIKLIQDRLRVSGNLA